MDDNFDETLKKLGQKVNQFTKGTTSKSYEPSSRGLVGRINIKALVVYGSPLIAIPLLLFYWKPHLVSEEVEDEEGNYKRRVNFRKLMVTTLISTLILDGLIFMYLRKKEINL
jgi:hypothetical protein